LLEELCEHKNIYIGDEKKSSSQLVKILANESFSIGLKKLLQSLTRDQLTVLGKIMEWEDNKIPYNKQVLVKRIHEEIEKVGPKEYLGKFKSDELEPLLHTLDLALPSKSKYVDALVEEANEIGLENWFSSFPVRKLQEFADASGLTVNSTSVEVLIDSILKHENHEPPKKKKARAEKPSKKKPAIKKGITKVDLNTHFYREELMEYCKEHGLRTQGNKKDFIIRILAHVEGRVQPPVKGAALKRRKGKKRKAEASAEKKTGQKS